MSGVALKFLVIVAGVFVLVLMFRAARLSGKPVTNRPVPLGTVWAERVDAAVVARSRFATIVASCTAGPLRDRLDELARTVEGTVTEVRRVARIGDAIDPKGRANTAPRRRLEALNGALTHAVALAGDLALESSSEEPTAAAELLAIRAALEEVAGER